MSNTLSLQVTLEAIDRLTSPLKAIKDVTQKVSASVSENTQKIRELNRQLAEVKGYQQAEKSLQKTRQELNTIKTALNEATQKQKDYRQEIAQTTARLEQYKAQIKAAKAAETTDAQTLQQLISARQHEETQLQGLKNHLKLHTEQHKQLTASVRNTERQEKKFLTTLSAHRSALEKNNIDLKQLEQTQSHLAQSVRKANAELKKQRQILKLRGEAQAHYDKSRAVNDSLKGKSLGAYYFGRRAMAGLSHPLEVYNEYQQVVNVARSQGLSDEQIHLAQTFSEKAGLFGQSQTENLKHWAEAYAITVDNHHASEAAALMGKLETGLKYLSASGSIDEKARDGLDKLPNDLIVQQSHNTEAFFY